MIFAEMEYQQEYWDFHAELVAFINTHFSQVQSGLQLDSWIWVFDGEEKVKIDTFSSTKHQVKSSKSGVHVRHVIETLLLQYKVNVYAKPELEEHEDV